MPVDMSREDQEYVQELMEEHRTLQCHLCAGWAVSCPCKENYFDRKTKKLIFKCMSFWNEQSKNIFTDTVLDSDNDNSVDF